VGLFSGERVLENTPTPLFEQPLKFIAHGRIFESLWFLWDRAGMHIHMNTQVYIDISVFWYGINHTGMN